MKKILSVLIVAVMIVSLSSTAFAAGGTWKQDRYGWWYLNSDGTYPANSWLYDGGSWYYFGSDGYMKTGWVWDGSAWYYMSPSGAMVTGWMMINGDWYYFSVSGVMLTGVQLIDGVYYEFDGSGRLLDSVSEIDVAVTPYEVEYYDENNILAWCTISNNTGYTIFDVEVSDFKISNSYGIAAWGDFGVLEDLELAPYTSEDWLFWFGPDAVYQKYGDLSYYMWSNHIDYYYYY